MVVDHLAFSTTLALRAAGQPFTTFVPGHPTQLPVAGEVYGFPSAWPRGRRHVARGLAAPAAALRGVRGAFTARYNEALRALAAGAEPVADAFAAHGADVLFNSPAALHPPGRADLPAGTPSSAAASGGVARCGDAAWRPTRAGRPSSTSRSGRSCRPRRRPGGRRRGAAARRRARCRPGRRPRGARTAAASWLVAPSLPQVALLAGPARSSPMAATTPSRRR